MSVPTQQLGKRNSSAFVAAIVAVVEAFQEALAMRRAAQSKYLLNDE
jgi:hypothetical protein